MQKDKLCYTWKEFLHDIYARIIPALRAKKKKFNGIWSPPRGGLIMAVILSHALGLPILMHPYEKNGKKTLIVDDIADKGESLLHFRKYFIITLFYHRQSAVVPSLWLHEKKDEWVVFPWEAD